MSVKNQRGFPSLRLVALAAVAGVLAGAVAVYVKEMSSGNGDPAVAAAPMVDCSGAVATAARLKPLATGDVAALTVFDTPGPVSPLVFADASGKAGSLADLAGKPLLVNLWATWCVPCREEMPALNALQKAEGGDGFEVVAINIDTGDNAKPAAFLKDNGIDQLPLRHDPSMDSFNRLKKEGLAFGLPVTLLVDGKGCMLGAMNGPAEWSGADAAALIKALKQKPDA